MSACSKCGLDERGVRGNCLPCKRLLAKARYAANRERLKEEQRKYNNSDRGRTVRAAQQRRLTSQIKFKYHISLFGLTVEDYARLLHGQDFKCACCGDVLQMGKHTHVDHCHTTGRVRSLLCHYCNTSLGLMRDDLKRITALLHYLEKYK